MWLCGCDVFTAIAFDISNKDFGQSWSVQRRRRKRDIQNALSRVFTFWILFIAVILRRFRCLWSNEETKKSFMYTFLSVTYVALK